MGLDRYLFVYNSHIEMAMTNQLSFCTFNLNNYNEIIVDKKVNPEESALEKMYNECTFMLLQETWKTENEFNSKFKKQFPDSECISASKMEYDDIKTR